MFNQQFSLRCLMFSASVFLFGCVATDQEAENTVSHTTLHQGLNPVSADSDIKTIRIVSNADDYRELLADYSAESAKTLDFNQYQIVLIDLGNRPSGGYSIRIDGVLEQNNHIVLEFTQLTPGTDCNYSEAQTNPYRFEAIKSLKEIVIQESIAADKCSQ
ncbi:MAG: protease complex subunit PrcB family protein [Saccharospirillaceae bacterium]|nr:protease complex subunit PrcB family protein [Saccharospirillaceae bacterium]MCD8530205.1 protease complex subunit PrcB family protein [Saccharospirillaceae bacterium]